MTQGIAPYPLPEVGGGSACDQAEWYTGQVRGQPAEDGGTWIYQASYRDQRYGDLRAYQGSLTPQAAWSAANRLTDQPHSGRQLLSFDMRSGKGVPVRWDAIGMGADSPGAMLDVDPDSHHADGLGAARLDWLRGSADQEAGQGGPFRDRGLSGGRHVLSDIVHSIPYLAPAMPQPTYVRSEERGSHAGFLASLKQQNGGMGRRPMVYVGANDGYLHGFDARDGHELFAYLPGELYPRLADLTSPHYRHRWYVDGSPVVADVYFHGSWHSVLVGGLGGGGRAYFALDVTDPDAVRESSAADRVLWELSSRMQPLLGHSFAVPRLVRMHHGGWAALIGNGYSDDTSGQVTDAALLVVNVADGSVLATLRVPSQDGTGSNGLSSPTAVDADGDGVVDSVYAGDLRGNLWKFDVTASRPGDWQVSFSGHPLFRAVDASGRRQPITSAPEVVRHRGGRLGMMVLFGTGSLFRYGDELSLDGQTFYGIWDPDTSAGSLPAGDPQDVTGMEVIEGYPRLNPGDSVTDHGADRRALLAQCYTDAVGACSDMPRPRSSGLFRTLSTHSQDWRRWRGWYIDLPGVGERVLAEPKVADGRVRFLSTELLAGGCTRRWLTEASIDSGAGQRSARLDVNRNGQIDAEDLFETAGEQVSASSRVSSASPWQLPQRMDESNAGETVDVEPGPDGRPIPGSRYVSTQGLGRRSWQQLR